MSSAAIPLTKPAGLRPPFGGPPTRTAFDSRPDDMGEPIHRRITESVQEVLKACKDLSIETAPLLRRLIEQRRRTVERELSMLRMFEPKPLPPLLTNLYSLEFLSDELDVERLYVRLLSDLDAAESRVAEYISERNG
jgi:hypothetical protein